LYLKVLFDRSKAMTKAKTVKKEIKAAPKVGIVSLGCPKALVDSERIITTLRSEGYELSANYEGADVVIVNTCGFLESAQKESLDAIGEAMAANGKVIVTGCMGAEPEKIRAIHPKVHTITGPQQYESVVSAVHEIVKPVHDPFVDLVPAAGLKLTPRHYAYLKISEGCNNRCTFCIIPKLRGDLVSRPAAHVLYEAENLVKAGVKELLVISQDTSAYGVDIKYAESIWRGKPRKAKFLDLAEALGELGVWVRMHYVYPYPHVDGVIQLMADGKITPYLDIPFQHAAPNVLKNMKRPASQEKTLERIKKWREICPDLTIRSSFVVGFPGETDEDFEFLINWLKEAQLDRVGCFKYEPVDGATSETLGLADVPQAVKDARWERLMEVQQGISMARVAAKVGRTLPCIIDEVDGEGGGNARSQADAPEIDGAVYLRDVPAHVKQGDIVNVLIEDADEYDLYGVII
jgi:ribosomal protein S12 methylthiotransferase